MYCIKENKTQSQNSVGASLDQAEIQACDKELLLVNDTETAAILPGVAIWLHCVFVKYLSRYASFRLYFGLKQELINLASHYFQLSSSPESHICITDSS